MDDQVIRVKRANDCPALLKSFRWNGEAKRSERREAGATRRERADPAWGVSRRGIYYGTTSWHSYFSLHSYLEAATGIRLLRRAREALRRNSQIHSRLRHSGLREGSFRDLTTCSIMRARAFHRPPSAQERARTRIIESRNQYFDSSRVLSDDNPSTSAWDIS